jgi:TM2 domain-containing membrane protein YozV
MHFPLVARYFPSVSPPVVPNLRQPSVPPTAIGTPHTVQPQVVVNNYVGGGPVPVAFDSGYKQKVVAGLLALFLGCLGIHQFYLGKNGLGVTMLLITVLTCGYGSLITGIWALIDAICIFTGSTRDAQGRILV